MASTIVAPQGQNSGLLREVDGHRPGKLDVHLLDADARGEGQVELGGKSAPDVLLGEGFALDKELADSPFFRAFLSAERLGEDGRVKLHQGHQDFAQRSPGQTTRSWSRKRRVGGRNLDVEHG
jgi:hypothetical protein